MTGGVPLSHPGDCTSLCTTEPGLTAKLEDEFARRHVKVIAVSVGPLEFQNGWRAVRPACT